MGLSLNLWRWLERHGSEWILMQWLCGCEQRAWCWGQVPSMSVHLSTDWLCDLGQVSLSFWTTAFPSEKWATELDILFWLQASSCSHWEGSSPKFASLLLFYLKQFLMVFIIYNRLFSKEAWSQVTIRDVVTMESLTKQLMIKCHLVGGGGCGGGGCTKYSKPWMKRAFPSKH